MLRRILSRLTSTNVCSASVNLVQFDGTPIGAIPSSAPATLKSCSQWAIQAELLGVAERESDSYLLLKEYCSLASKGPWSWSMPDYERGPVEYWPVDYEAGEFPRQKQRQRMWTIDDSRVLASTEFAFTCGAPRNLIHPECESATLGRTKWIGRSTNTKGKRHTPEQVRGPVGRR